MVNFIPTVRPGEPISAEQYNNLVQAVNALLGFYSGNGVNFTFSGGRLNLKPRKTHKASQKTQPVAAAGATWSWAQVVTVSGTFFTAKLVDTLGVPTGDPFRVNVYAAIAQGFSATPDMTKLHPYIYAGQYVKIEQRATGFRSAEIHPDQTWWLCDTAAETCT